LGTRVKKNITKQKLVTVVSLKNLLILVPMLQLGNVTPVCHSGGGWKRSLYSEANMDII
jgi:hypothetical protein